MWKSVVGHDVSVKLDSQGDDWETDPDFVNDVSEKEQRWGAKSIEGSGRAEHINIHQLRSKVSEEHEVLKKEEMEGAPRASYGYGGKFGKEKDRMDKSAVGHEYVSEVRMHPSQTDAAKGFGGKFGIQKDRADKLALGFEYKGQVEKHPSQKDYAVGFGGKFGLQKDRQDQSALGWAHKEEVQPHPSQTDYSQGFGGRYGVQRDRMDQSAAGFSEMAAPTSSYQKAKAQEAAAAGTGGLRQRFEDMAKAAGEEGRKQAEVAGGRRPAQEFQAAQRQPKGKTEMTEPELEPPPVPGRPAGEAGLPPLPPGHQEENRPPALPPWKLDSPESPRETPAPPCVQETPIYLEGINDGGDYEEVLGNGGLQEPPPFVNDEDVGGDYEEMPDHRNIFSAEVDQDYEEIPSRLPGGPGGGSSSGPVYDLDEGELSATALYEYQGEGDDEISFDPGDTITAIKQVDEGWWRGRCRGKVGLFPANYVELLP